MVYAIRAGAGALLAYERIREDTRGYTQPYVFAGFFSPYAYGCHNMTKFVSLTIPLFLQDFLIFYDDYVTL